MATLTLTTAAARRALHCRSSRMILRPHAGAPAAAAAAAAIVDRSSGVTESGARIGACTISSWNRCPSTTLPILNRHQDSVIIHRSFSSASTETATVSPTAEASSNDGNSNENNTSLDPTNPSKSKRRRRPKNKPANKLTSDKEKAEASSLALPPLTKEEYHPQRIVNNIYKAARWNQGKYVRNRKRNLFQWNYEFVRLTVDDYERHLRYVLDHLNEKKSEKGQKENDQKKPSTSTDLLSDIHPSPHHCDATHSLLAPQTLANAARALTRCKMDTPLLSQRIRDIERLVGLIGWTPITEELSYRLLEANGKAGNVRRTLALLELRRRRGYVPREQERPYIPGQETTITPTTRGLDFERGEKEFIHALTSIQAAQLPLRRSRNIYLHESAFTESSLDNPTRYLDAILLNMSQRGVPLRPQMASQMLACYASTGRTGRALHYFYKVVRDPIEEDGYYIPGPHPTSLGKEELEAWKEERRREGVGRFVVSGLDEEKDDGEESTEEDASSSKDEEDSITMEILHGDAKEDMTKVRMIMHPPPPFHKVPSHVKGTHLAQGDGEYRKSFISAPKNNSTESTNSTTSSVTKTRYEWETSREWSLSLTAAFAFADSLTHGACGHDPIELDVGGWNCLIKACCYRGAFHRALKIIEETMPQKGVKPDVVSYNTILAGLARVGDVASLKETLMDMTNRRVGIDKYTVQAVTDGFLNVGDISGASSLVQDVFNQHDTLPPYTTHLKIIEFALANGLVFEAKRHVYFVQQLWKWVPSKHHEEEFCKEVEMTKRNPKLNKEALITLFRHFREELNDADFF